MLGGDPQAGQRCGSTPVGVGSPSPFLEATASAMKGAAEELTQASHKLAEAIYAKASQHAAGGAEGQGPTGDGQAQSTPKGDAVDADFEEVKG